MATPDAARSATADAVAEPTPPPPTHARVHGLRLLLGRRFAELRGPLAARLSEYDLVRVAEDVRGG